MSRPLCRLPIVALLGAVLVLASSCGGGGFYAPYPRGGYVPPLYGGVEVDNLSPEFVETFFLAPAASDLWTGNLFLGPLPPFATVYVGDFVEDVYDAEADMEFGDLVQWFDVFVPGGDTTIFEVY